MKRLIRVALCLALLGAAIPIAEVASATQRSSARIVRHRVGQSRGDVLEFWTRERMAKAKPLLPTIDVRRVREGSVARSSGEPTVIAPAAPAREYAADLDGYQGAPDIPFVREEVVDPAAEEVRAHGKVFFTAGGSTYVCSGTVVNSSGLDVVWTAGHCVYDPGSGGYVRNWMFAPAYRLGSSPYGRFTANELYTTAGWATSGNFEADFGAATVDPVNGAEVQSVVGARGIAFNLAGDQSWNTYGYPANPSDGFDGQREYVCVTGTGYRINYGPSTPDLIAIGCDMTQGSSGGGWVINGTTVNSVVSAGSPQFPDTIFGPYQGNIAKQLYEQAASGEDPGEITPHGMKLTLKLKARRKLIMKGKLSAVDGFAPCGANAQIILGKVVSPTQAVVLKRVRTNSTGAYRAAVPKKKGRYVALAEGRPSGVSDVCGPAQSPLRRHR